MGRLLASNVLYQEIREIKACLNNDGVICYPTEGVWGLGCLPQSKKAFQKILNIKQRSQKKGVILIASQYSQIEHYAQINEALQQKLSGYWPGFITCVLPKHKDCPNYLTGSHNEVAIRITAYQPLIYLCHYLSSAIVSTSANLSGFSPVKNIKMAKQLFGEQVNYYWDAPLGKEKKPSVILKFNNNQVTHLRK